MSIRETHLSFEIKMWLIVTSLGSLRVIWAVVQDVNDVTSVEFFVDACALLVLLGLTMSLLVKKVSRIPLFQGIILVILAMLDYIQFGGIAGTTKYNLIGMVFLLVFCYEGKRLFFMLSTLFLLVAIAEFDISQHGFLSELLFVHVSHNSDSFLSTLIAILVAMLYFKRLLDLETGRLFTARNHLGEQNTLIREHNKRLEHQQQLLSIGNGQLKSEIDIRSRKIQLQDKAIEEFIMLSTSSLDYPMQAMYINGNELDQEATLESKLKFEISSLHEIAETIKNDLEK